MINNHCLKTGNPCGTDTYSVCDCSSCQAWIKDPAAYVNIVREQLKTAAAKKYRSMFSTTCCTLMSIEMSERNIKWSEEVDWINMTCDRMIEMLKDNYNEVGQQ